MSKSLLAGLLVLGWIFPVEAKEPARRPNIVLVLTDDLGYGDLACYGHKIVKTPNLDRFAKEGLRLTSCYAAHANCSPSRAGIMTGRTPTRVGIHNWIPFMSPAHLRKEETTIATLLQKSGYTTAHVGKWHLNGTFNLPGQPQPNDHGFDHWFATQNNALPNHRNPYNFVRNGIPVGPLEGYSADLVTDEAIEWMTKARDKSKPFFLFVCYHEPHEPIASAEKYTKMYPSDDPSKSAHHGNITQMDDAFGRLMKSLDEQSLRENTLVFFTSDNGPAITSIHPHGSPGPLRAKKGHMYEGGIRVPGILRWPGHVQPGTTSDVPICGVDVLPTFAAVAGVATPTDRVLDGTNILPMLDGKPLKRKTPLYWHFVCAVSDVKVAVRDGDWKLLARLDRPFQRGGDILAQEQTDLKRAKLIDFELYNLSKDIAESEDVKAKHPEKFAELKGQMERKYLEVCEECPTWPAWDWPRYEGKRIEWPAYRKRPRK